MALWALWGGGATAGGTRLPCFFVICVYLKLSLSSQLSLPMLVDALVCSSLPEGLRGPSLCVGLLVNNASLFKGDQLLI
jgi:hypothetical protein